MIEKDELRKTYSVKRTELHNKENKSELIQQKVIEHIKVNNYKIVLTYVGNRSEVETMEIIEYLLENNYEVYIPHNTELKLWELNNIDEISFDAKGYAYSDEELTNPPDKIDLAITPGLAFTSKGDRLGRGSGWFDKFYSSNNIGFKIGICFIEQIVGELPLEEHDVKMDLIITD